MCMGKVAWKTVPANHPLTLWLLEHSILLLTAMVTGEDGKTPWARARGRAFGQRLTGFGEQVLWKLLTEGPNTMQKGICLQDNKKGGLSFAIRGHHGGQYYLGGILYF